MWHTWSDYDRFHALNDRFVATGEGFTSLDYMAPTPAVRPRPAPPRARGRHSLS